jgi:hypothetical protein
MQQDPKQHEQADLAGRQQTARRFVRQHPDREGQEQDDRRDDAGIVSAAAD